MGWETARRQSSASGPGRQTRSNGVGDVLRSPARALDPRTRTAMHSRFGRDFSDVKLHAGPAAAASAKEVGAAAYAVDEHVVLDRERAAEQPGGVAGVLEHELGHVAERRAGAVPAGILQRLPDTRRAGSTLPYREAVEELERRRTFTPAGARVTDTRPAVESADQAAAGRLVDFVARAEQQFRTLLAGAAPKGQPWLTVSNENIQIVLRLIRAFLQDVQGGGINIRFDQARSGMTAAHYTEGENTIHLRPVANDEDAARVLPDLLHEYAHATQDREAARAVMAGRVPAEHTREAELRKETEARLVDVYSSQLLSRAGMAATGGQESFETLITGGILRSRFEQVRTGGPKERAAAAKAIRGELEGPYQTQLDRFTPAVRYPIEITPSNTARLTMYATTKGPTDVDLGPIPASVTTREQLRSHIAGALSAQPWFDRLFQGPLGKRFVVASFFVFFRTIDERDELILQFSLAPSTPAVATPPAKPPVP